MPQSLTPQIVITGAKTNNLKNLSLSIPHNKFIVVTGVSGSGKSSLVFDIIAKEGQRRYFVSRSLFSFNSAIGRCQACKGIGKQEQIDLHRLVTNPQRSIREGALAPTLPNGYIMYSQVTINVLNQVCEAEGFNVDIPWNDLTGQQRKVVLYGSDRIKVPFGKHSLASRLKWTGIKAKPREEGFYKGMIPIMSDILRRDRNANILKYVHAVTCPTCRGARLNPDALSVTVHGKSIAELCNLELNQLKDWIDKLSWEGVSIPIVNKIAAQFDLLENLGLGHLTLDRSSKSLRPSEVQRIRIANQILEPLSDVLYVFDEPSIGLHRDENTQLIHHLKTLVRKGNTVIVVEHDLHTIASAEHIIEIGPGAGINGGEVLFNGPKEERSYRTEPIPRLRSQVLHPTSIVPTQLSLPKQVEDCSLRSGTTPCSSPSINLLGCSKRNLKNIND